MMSSHPTINTAQPHVELAISRLKRAELELAPTTLATAFGLESGIMIHLIARLGLEIPVFSIDTGRLPDETYQVAEQLEERYGLKIQWLFPATGDVEQYVSEHGINGFRKSPELRRGCCHVRKVLPQQRALIGKKSWLSGQRQAHSAERANLQAETWDPARQLFKILPLLEWSDSQVWEFIRDFSVPYNALYDRGYSSIGCASCSRAITSGEPTRAGRWWWEDEQYGKECGLHVDYFNNGGGI